MKKILTGLVLSLILTVSAAQDSLKTLSGQQVTEIVKRFHPVAKQADILMEKAKADLTSARLRVKDIGGYWEARMGSGERSVYLKSGGDVTLVTDQKVEPLPPNYILGQIEKPT